MFDTTTFQIMNKKHCKDENIPQEKLKKLQIFERTELQTSKEHIQKVQ